MRHITYFFLNPGLNIMGIRDYRIAGMAIFDWVATMIAAYGIAYGIPHFMPHFMPQPYNTIVVWFVIFVILVLLSIPLHRLFRVDSVLTNYLLPPVKN